MKFRTGIILCTAAAAALVFTCKQEAPREVQVEKPVFNFKVQFVSGDVKVITSSGKKKAAAGDMIAVSDTIVTGKKSLADLTYGTCGIIRISENSRVSISVIAGGNSAESMIEMDRGKIFLTLGKLQNTGFKVKTPTVVASVRGTSFVVSADQVKGARLSVMKGTVTVAPVSRGEAITGKELSVGAGQKMDYVSSKTVDQVLTGRGVISIKPMTEAEIMEIKKTAVDIRVDEIKGLDEDIRSEVKKDVIEADPKTLIQQAKEEADKQQGDIDNIRMKINEKYLPDKQQGISDNSNLQGDNNDIKMKIDDKKRAEEQRKLEEEKRIQEMKKQAEEEEARKRERLKEKASSIPTL